MGSKILNKVFIYGSLTLLILILLSGALFANDYLKKNNYLFYATGTHDKAFLKSTWEMSKNEVARSNQTKLEPLDNPIYCPFINMEAGTNRITCYQADMNVFGETTEIRYYFFDNKFYEYDITIPIIGYPDASKVLDNLEKRFGGEYTENIFTNDPGTKFPEKLKFGLSVLLSSDLQYYVREWKTQKEIVFFQLNFPRDQLKENFYDFKNKDISKDAYISVAYSPMIKTIEEEIKREESSYF